VVLRHMWDRSKLFLRRAGTVILGINILLWFLASYPKDTQAEAALETRRAALQQGLAPGTPTPPAVQQQLDALDHEAAGERLRHSLAGRAGHLLEPLIAPLGFDWKIGIGLVASFAAREVFVSTMAVVYNLGEEAADHASEELAGLLRAEKRADGRPLYTPLVAVTLMVFYVFALQCVSTIAVVRRETNSWKWPLFQWAYMGALAWGMAFLTYQGGRLLGFE
jgi:ferrous iron transport protein B